MDPDTFQEGLKESLRDLQRDGVCVVRGVISPAEALEAYRAQVAWVEHTQTRFKLDEPATHPTLEGVKRGGMLQELGAGCAGFMFDLRSKPRLLRALAFATAAMEDEKTRSLPLDEEGMPCVDNSDFVRISDSEEEAAEWARRLVTSLDSFNLLPPPEVWRAYMSTRTREHEKDWMHLDQAFYETSRKWNGPPIAVEGFRGVQAFVVLQPIRDGDAEFECIPGAFAHHSELVRRAGERWYARGDERKNIGANWHILEPADLAFLAEKLAPQGPDGAPLDPNAPAAQRAIRRHVQAEPGDLVIWDSRTPHKGSYPRADREIPRIRSVAYITAAFRRGMVSEERQREHDVLNPGPDFLQRRYKPAPRPSRFSEENRRKRLMALACGDTMCHWPTEFCKTFGYQPRQYGGHGLSPRPAARVAARQARSAAIRAIVGTKGMPTPEDLYHGGHRVWYIDGDDDVLGPGCRPPTHTQLMLAGLTETEADFVESLREPADEDAPIEAATTITGVEPRSTITDAQVLALFGLSLEAS